MIDPASFPSKHATLNGNKYFYIDQPARGKQKGTVVLVHGWPDSWYGWRYQIPFLAAAGYRVLCISQLGFGYGTDAPQDLVRYTYRSVCADLSALLRHEGVRRAVFWGHDWGGFVVFRMAHYYAKMVQAVISLSTPYFPPARGRYQTLEEQAKVSPNFQYQVYLASGQASRDFRTADDFRKFFNALFQPGKGMKLQFNEVASLPTHSPTTLVSREEIEVYVQQYTAAGLQSSTNWYRTRRLNYDDDKANLPSAAKLEMPVLFIATELDPVLRPEYSRGMEQYIPRLTRGSVKTGHWGLVEAKDEVNAYVGEFLMRLHLEKMRHSI